MWNKVYPINPSRGLVEFCYAVVKIELQADPYDLLGISGFTII